MPIVFDSLGGYPPLGRCAPTRLSAFQDKVCDMLAFFRVSNDVLAVLSGALQRSDSVSYLRGSVYAPAVYTETDLGRGFSVHCSFQQGEKEGSAGGACSKSALQGL